MCVPRLTRPCGVCEDWSWKCTLFSSGIFSIQLSTEQAWMVADTVTSLPFHCVDTFTFSSKKSKTTRFGKIVVWPATLTHVHSKYVIIWNHHSPKVPVLWVYLCEERDGGSGQKENWKILTLKDSSIRSTWIYPTASPCYTTNTNKHYYITHAHLNTNKQFINALTVTQGS